MLFACITHDEHVSNKCFYGLVDKILELLYQEFPVQILVTATVSLGKAFYPKGVENMGGGEGPENPSLFYTISL